MNKYIIDYINDIGLSSPLQKRVKDIIDFHMNFYSFDIKNIFISDYIKDDGTKVFENTFLFTNLHIVESINFIKHDEYKITKINNIGYTIIKRYNYSFDNYTINSRLNINSLINNEIFEFKATGVNCKYLKDIYASYFMKYFID